MIAKPPGNRLDPSILARSGPVPSGTALPPATPSPVAKHGRIPIARAFLAAVVAALGLAGCRGPGAAPPQDAANGQTRPQDRDAIATSGLAVVDRQGHGIVGAQVLIGSRQGIPFNGNFVASKAGGAIPAPSAWTTPLPVTIDAPGFVRATFFARLPTSGAMELRPLPAPQRLVLKGVTNGFGNLTNDGWVHVGLVFPALARAELGRLQISSFLSPELDALSAGGRTANIPSNVSVPKQRVSYGIIPLTLEKPIYRAFFEAEGTYKIVSAHARFPFSDGVGMIQDGKPFLEMVDSLEFLGASLTDVAVAAPGAAADLFVDGIAFPNKYAIGAPIYDARYSALAFVVNESGGRLYPSDVKHIASGKSKGLAFPADAGDAKAIFLLQEAHAPTTGAASEQMSILIVAASQAPGDFMATPAPPALAAGRASGRSLVAAPPALPVGTAPGTTYAALSTVQQIASGKNILERKIGQWDLYGEGWVASFDLPEWPQAAFAPTATGALRWEVAFGAFPAGAAAALGPKALEKASHVAKSAVDL